MKHDRTCLECGKGFNLTEDDWVDGIPIGPLLCGRCRSPKFDEQTIYELKDAWRHES